MLASTAQEINSPLHQLMVSLESIMCSLVLVYHYCKVTRMKFLRSLSTLRVIKSSLLVAIRPVVFGQLIMETRFRYSKVMKMKYSHAHSTTRVTLLLLGQRIILAEYGRTIMQSKLRQVNLMVDNSYY